jgi:hypothetical protein
LVANLRVDQAWGGAQIMGALHEVNANYYSPTTGAAASIAAGHPSDKWGWAAGAGLKINAPFITQGDWFQAQVNVTQGALRYLFNTPNTNWGKVDGSTESYGMLTDCVYDVGPGGINPTGCQLTSAWGFNAGYEHYWTPAWHTALYGAWYEVSYGSTANAQLCANQGFGAGSGTPAVAFPGCSNNWSTWGVGARTQWDVTKTFYLGVEVLYSEMKSATTTTGFVPAINAISGPSGALTIANESNWMVSVRAHRDFLP